MLDFLFFIPDNSTLDFSQYPTRDAQLSWLRNYFVHKVELDERLPQDVSDVEMERYYVMANKFALVRLGRNADIKMH